MRTLLLATAFLAAMAMGAWAFDGSMSVEYDHIKSDWAADYDHRGSWLQSYDTILNVGQPIGKYRPYIQVEYTTDNSMSPDHRLRDSFLDYRLGVTYDIIPNVLQIDHGMGVYGYNNNLNEHNVPYLYGKLTWSFSTEKK